MRILRFLLLPVLIFSLAGCADLNDTQQRALTGGAIGAAGGAIIGAAAAGNPAAGAAIGGAVGAAGGVIIPQLGHDAARLVGAS